jgi:uncharacterized membrane protein YhiD involved in acid resistance
MTTIQVIQSLFSSQSNYIVLQDFIINLMLGAVMAILLGMVYAKFGRSLSNRKVFARNFLIITLTTLFIIAIVQSSLALALGLVGALSIVRFRAAIKEPEELAFLFFAIGLGVGLGANQRIITVAAFIILMGIMILRDLSSFSFPEEHNLYATISGTPSSPELAAQILAVCKKHLNKINLKRLEESSGHFEIVLFVQVNTFEELQRVKVDIMNIDSAIHLTFVDSKGIVLD